MTRHRFRLTGALAIGLVILAILGGERPAPAQSPSAIKIGLRMPGTGPFTVNAQRITTGVRLYFQSKDWQVAGRKIELVAEDDQGDPQVSLTQTQKLVELHNTCVDKVAQLGHPGDIPFPPR